MLLFLVVGCMRMDSFFFSPEATAAYALDSDVIPAEAFEEVAFPTEDGLTLYGVWAHQLDAGAPVVLYFHGNYRHIDEYIRQVGDYWSYGYRVFIFDYQGYGKSEGDPSWDGILADGRAAVAYVEDATGLEPGTYPYVGLSLGGTVAVQTAVTNPPSVLITEDMFASGQKLINDGSALDLPDGWLIEDEWDNLPAAAAVDVPYLVIHGDSDTYIQPSHGEAMFAATNATKDLWLVPGGTHAEDALAQPVEYRTRVTCWIDQSCAEE